MDKKEFNENSSVEFALYMYREALKLRGRIGYKRRVKKMLSKVLVMNSNGQEPEFAEFTQGISPRCRVESGDSPEVNGDAGMDVDISDSD